MCCVPQKRAGRIGTPFTAPDEIIEHQILLY